MLLEFLTRFESLAYILAALLFILALAGLSQQKTALGGNRFGIVGMAFIDANEGVTRILPINRLRKGIDVTREGDSLIVDLHVVVEQGVNMASVCQNLADTVKFLLKKIAELDNVEVRVHIEGMRSH